MNDLHAIEYTRRRASQAEAALLSHLAEAFPRQVGALAREPRRQLVNLALDGAEAWDIQTLAGRKQILSLILMLGAQFDSDPLLPWARKTLEAHLIKLEGESRVVKNGDAWILKS